MHTDFLAVASLQGELEVLEHMLSELETETENLEHLKYANESLLGQEEDERSLGAEQQEREYDEPDAADLQQQQREQSAGHEHSRLGQVCYKSLSIGLELTRKVDGVRNTGRERDRGHAN